MIIRIMLKRIFCKGMNKKMKNKKEITPSKKDIGKHILLGLLANISLLVFIKRKG